MSGTQHFTLSCAWNHPPREIAFQDRAQYLVLRAPRGRGAKNLVRYRFAHLRPRVQWLLLAVLSAVFAALLDWAGLPAAFFLGPMAAGVIAGIDGATIRVPVLPNTAAQAVMGCFIASAITPQILSSFLKDWPVIAGAVFAILAAASV